MTIWCDMDGTLVAANTDDFERLLMDLLFLGKGVDQGSDLVVQLRWKALERVSELRGRNNGDMRFTPTFEFLADPPLNFGSDLADRSERNVHP